MNLAVMQNLLNLHLADEETLFYFNRKIKTTKNSSFQFVPGKDHFSRLKQQINKVTFLDTCLIFHTHAEVCRRYA